MEGIVDFIYRDDREDLEEVLSSTSAEQKEILKTIWDRDSETNKRRTVRNSSRISLRTNLDKRQTGGAH